MSKQRKYTDSDRIDLLSEYIRYDYAIKDQNKKFKKLKSDKAKKKNAEEVIKLAAERMGIWWKLTEAFKETPNGSDRLFVDNDDNAFLFIKDEVGGITVKHYPLEDF